MSEFVRLSAPPHPPTIQALPKSKNQQNNTFCLPLIGFPQKFHNICIEKQIHIPS